MGQGCAWHVTQHMCLPSAWLAAESAGTPAGHRCRCRAHRLIQWLSKLHSGEPHPVAAAQSPRKPVKLHTVPMSSVTLQWEHATEMNQ